MHKAYLTSLIIALAFSAAPLYSQPSADPSGHWEGSIQRPERSINVEVDLAKAAGGELGGAIGMPDDGLKGLPLQKVSVEGRTISFQARSDQPFSGTLSADGKSLSGNLSVMGSSVPISFTRTGDAHIEAPEKSLRISKALEGAWTATIAAEGTELHLVLTMVNQPDGTALGRMVNLDEGGITVPATITEAGSHVTLRFKAIGASYTGTVSNDGASLTGTYEQGTESLPVRFERSSAKQ